MTYGEFFKAYPLLGHRLHTLHCESCKPGGVSEDITYEGTETDGSGVVAVKCFYSGRAFPFTVTNGVIRAFGRQQDMRKPTRMKLHTGGVHWSTYDRELILTATTPSIKVAWSGIDTPGHIQQILTRYNSAG